MTNQRSHYVTTTDGVTIGGTVHGQGPPLVFVQGIIGDGDLDWQALLPHLTDSFTCHLPSMRGRGLSGNHPDLSLSRLADDLLTYVDSIEGPVRLVGWSLGAGVALIAAGTHPDEVDALVAVGPLMPGLLAEAEKAAFGAAVARTGELAAQGSLTNSTRAFAGSVFDDEEIAVAEDARYMEASGRYVPNMLGCLQQQMEYTGPVPWDADLLSAISASVLALYGSKAKQSPDAVGARHLVAHVPNAQAQEIPGAGHALPLTHPEALAEALTEFFSSAQQPA